MKIVELLENETTSANIASVVVPLGQKVIKRPKLKEYSYEDLTTYGLSESSENGWTILKSSAFKKGLKKHSNNKRVMDAYNAIIAFIVGHDREPAISTYPPEYNVHPIKKDAKFIGSIWAHLVGQKIGLLFFIDGDKKELKLAHLGTHQEIGWS